MVIIPCLLASSKIFDSDGSFEIMIFSSWGVISKSSNTAMRPLVPLWLHLGQPTGLLILISSGLILGLKAAAIDSIEYKMSFLIDSCGTVCFLQSGHNRLTNLWAKATFRDDGKRNGSTPISTNLGM